MTNNNNNNGYIPTKEFNLNIPETATVSFYDAETNQNLSLEEWRALNPVNSSQVRIVNRGETYQSEKALSDEPSYGPCPDMWNESDAGDTSDSGFQAMAFSTKGRVEGGASERVYASAVADISGFRFKDDVGDLKLGSFSAGAEAGIGSNGVSAKYKLGADIANVKIGGTKINAGIDVGSEASIGEGSAKLKVGGVGFSVGKEIGISTPFGGVSVNLEETCNQQ